MCIRYFWNIQKSLPARLSLRLYVRKNTRKSESVSRKPSDNNSETSLLHHCVASLLIERSEGHVNLQMFIGDSGNLVDSGPFMTCM